MRNLATLAGFGLLLAVGGIGVFAGGLCPGGKAAPPAKSAARSGERGAVTGAFDSGMSGACRFACAAPQAYDERDLAPQPWATNGRLTRCPVSGVVFVVDEQRPRVQLAPGEYILCCDGCTKKFRKNPGRFVNL